MEGTVGRSSSPLRLPLNLTTFIGREPEIAQVAPLVLTHRLVTLTGSGGAGKTRLALEVAGRLGREFADGVCVVALASLAEPALVADRVAQVLGLREPAGTPVLERLSAYLNERNLLLLLDNCEHLIEACADLADSLLPNCCGDLRILTTSREPLGVPGEIEWRVPPLPVPPAEALGDDVLVAESYGAVHLFVQRAREAAPDFALTPQNSSSVSAICRRLDGMPLAIELAAARVKVLTPQQIEARLEDALGLLGGGGRTTPPRHRTMRAAIDWSYRLLAEQPAAVLRRLAVFRGGCTLDGAAAVCSDAGVSPDEALEIIAELADKSLVVARAQGAEMRYYLLEVIRQFAGQELRARGEEEAARERHLDYYLALAEAAKPELRSPSVRIWLDRLDLEHDNLRSALDYALERADTSARFCDAGFRLSAALEPFWRIRSHFGEGLAWLTRILETRAAREQPALRGRALIDAANLTWPCQGTQAKPLIEESIGIWRQVQPESTWELAEALRILGMIQWSIGDHAHARTVLEESLALFRRLGDERGVADVVWNIGATLLCDDPTLARELLEQAVAIYDRLSDPSFRPHYQLANLAMLRGDYAEARTIYERLLAEAREDGNKVGIGAGLLALGYLARFEGHLEEARAMHTEAVRFVRDFGGAADEELEDLAFVLVAQGDYREARALFGRCLASFRRAGDAGEIAGCLLGLADIKIALDRAGEAAQLLGAAEEACERAGRDIYARHRTDWSRCVKCVSAALDASALATAWATGRGLTLDAAIELGMRMPDAESVTPASALTPLRAAKAQFGGLTAREREIAGAVASGKSNREIADELVVSERTVEAHVGNILSKLEFTSRTQIATWALEKGLVRTGSGRI